MPDILGYWDRRADDPDYVGDDFFGGPIFKRKLKSETVTFYLFRHAEAKINLSPEIIWGRSNDSELTEKGKSQARELERKITSKRISFDKILFSPAVRTFETLQYALPNYSSYNISMHYSLQELDQGKFTGKRRNLVFNKKRSYMRSKDHWNFEAPGGESQSKAAFRMESCLKEYTKNPQFFNIAVFTHGGSIKYLCTKLFDWDRNTAWKRRVDNASMTQIEYKNGLWELIKFNS